MKKYINIHEEGGKVLKYIGFFLIVILAFLAYLFIIEQLWGTL